MSIHETGARPLSGPLLILAALVLSVANFVAILDVTIANVSVTTIAGNLGITTSQGTWVITSYAVAEAITVPLTGWLAGRFGAVQVFVCSIVLFGVASILCGLSTSLAMLVVARVVQGLAGGPILPLSQTLLLTIFPKEKATAATALWAMTTLVAPIVGPMLGGYICDNATWHWIFFINVPIALFCAWAAWLLVRSYESVPVKAPIDVVGLLLLIIWVGALQLMLDQGKDLDWFSSPVIVTLAITTVVGFIAFLIWELTAAFPVVDLRVFRHRGFTICVISLVIAFGALFGVNVLTPLWLQSYMGYTSTWAGLAVAWMGVLAVLCAPLAALLLRWLDPRMLIFVAVSWLAAVTLWRAFGTTEMTYWQIALPLLVMGAGMPLFFVPLMGAALGSVETREMASAAGLMSFLRTVSGAFATSLTNTAWEDGIKLRYAELVEQLDRFGDALQGLQRAGLSLEAARATLSRLTEVQAVMLATNQLFLVMALVFFVAACTIWLAPRPRLVAESVTTAEG